MTVFEVIRCLFHQDAPHCKHTTPVPPDNRWRRPYHPTVETLEARLALGDAVLGSVAGWWLGASVMPLETESRPTDEQFSSAWAVSSVAETITVGRLTGSFRLLPRAAAERPPVFGARSEAVGPQAAVFWDAFPVWQPHTAVIGRLMYAITAAAPTPFALSLPSAGGTAVPLTVAASPANFLPSSAPGGSRHSTSALLGSPTVSQSAAPAKRQEFGRTVLSFEANQGQTDPQVQFLARGSGYTVFLTSTEAVLALRPPQPAADTSALASVPHAKAGLMDSALSPVGSAADGGEGAVLRMQLLGGNPAAQARGGGQLPGIVNYFLGNDSSQWHTRIPTYAQVHYQNVYPGVDLVYYGNQQQLEYDFQLAPGADPTHIRLGFAGAQSVSVDATGALIVQAGGQVLRHHAPAVYQDVAGQRQRVTASFVVQGSEVGFALGNYDHGRLLVIDPVLSYSTYLGGSGTDFGTGIAVDAAGNAYITGWTASRDFPTVNPLQPTNAGGPPGDDFDVFVTKLTPDGSALVYATYLGGMGYDAPSGIAVDATGNAYVTGTTHTRNFPTANPLQATYGGPSDAFLAKLTAEGSALVYATYIGGSDVDVSGGIAVDSAGNACVTGRTTSLDFPTANALQPAYGGGSNGDTLVAKVSADGSALAYSTYLGGSEDDTGRGIAVDAAGNAFVTGYTASPNFPIVNPLQSAFDDSYDAFVAKLSADGSALVYSTYLGGSGYNSGLGIAVDAAGNACVIGATTSLDFPTVNALQPNFGNPNTRGRDDAFVAKLTADGSALVYSTYLGGSEEDAGYAIAVDAGGNAFVTGLTYSTDFPTADPLQPTLSNPYSTVFVANLSTDGSALVYSTHLGGSERDFGYGIAVDGAGNAFVTGTTSSPDFRTVNALQPSYGGGEYGDAFVAKISPY